MSVYRPKSMGQNHDLSAVTEEVKKNEQNPFSPNSYPRQ